MKKKPSKKAKGIRVEGWAVVNQANELIGGWCIYPTKTGEATNWMKWYREQKIKARIVRVSVRGVG